MSFVALLDPVLEQHPAVRGVVFCDYEGEMVSQCVRPGELEPDELRLIGATATTWLATFTRQTGTPPEELTLAVTTEGQRLLVLGLRGGYHLVAVLRPYGWLTPVERALRTISTRLDKEL